MSDDKKPISTSEQLTELHRALLVLRGSIINSIKVNYDKYVYPIVCPPAIAVVKAIRRLANWFADNMRGGGNETS